MQFFTGTGKTQMPRHSIKDLKLTKGQMQSDSP
jgi:hypothetical protein